MINTWTLLEVHKDQIIRMLNTLHQLANNPDFVKTFAAQMSKSNSFNGPEKKYAHLGVFNESSFMIANLITKPSPKSYPMFLLSSVLDELRKNRILFKYLVGNDLLSMNKELFNFFWEMDWLQSLIFGISYLPVKYQSSVFKICVSKNDCEYSGSGFLLKFKNQNGASMGLIISNKHVLENQIISVSTSDGKQYKPRKLILDPQDDIGAVLLTNEDILGNTSFNLLDDYNLGEDTVTLGYPQIPFTQDSSLIIHKGEFNGIVTTFKHKKRLLFSAKTGPGNSGGPLTTSYGAVIGLIEESLFDQDKYINKGIQPYNIAIPAEDIRNFLNLHVLLETNYEPLG